MIFASKPEVKPDTNQQALEAVLAKLELVEHQLDEKMELVQRQINELSARVALFPQPLRPRWVRQSRPAWEAETLILPTTRRASRKLEAVQPHIDRVTICISGRTQTVHSYDIKGNEIKPYSGPFEEVGLRVLEKFGDKPWEIVSESA